MIHIVQCLCPKRHAIMAMLYDADEPREIAAVDQLRSAVEEAIAKGLLNPWCGICASRQFTYEDQPTMFRTMAEAKPAAKRMEAENLWTADQFQQLRQTGRN